jgi:hypothetical protein
MAIGIPMAIRAFIQSADLSLEMKGRMAASLETPPTRGSAASRQQTAVVATVTRNRCLEHPVGNTFVSPLLPFMNPPIHMVPECSSD